MEKPNIKYNIFELSAIKFEELCADLLNAEYQFDKFFITDGPNDNGVDILALKGIKKLAIQIKHRYRIANSQLAKEIEKYKHLLEFHHEFIFMTSAHLAQDVKEDLESDKIKIISQQDILNLLEKHSDIAQRYFNIVEKKNKKNRQWLSTSIVGAIISIILSLFTFNNDKKDKTLSERIDNVEQTLQGIKGLEKDLESIKSDMIETDTENKKIMAEYKKMKGLENIVKDNKETLNDILNYQPWYKKILSYVLVFITGICTSIFASILLEKWKLRRELNK
jgi:hypothetical protein